MTWNDKMRVSTTTNNIITDKLKSRTNYNYESVINCLPFVFFCLSKKLSNMSSPSISPANFSIPLFFALTEFNKSLNRLQLHSPRHLSTSVSKRLPFILAIFGLNIV